MSIRAIYPTCFQINLQQSVFLGTTRAERVATSAGSAAIRLSAGLLFRTAHMVYGTGLYNGFAMGRAGDWEGFCEGPVSRDRGGTARGRWG